MQAVPLLVSVVSLLMFFLFLFGIAGIMLFSSAAHYECISVIDGSTDPALSNNYPDEWGCGGARTCPTNYTCQASSTGHMPSCPRICLCYARLQPSSSFEQPNRISQQPV